MTLRRLVAFAGPLALLPLVGSAQSESEPSAAFRIPAVLDVSAIHWSDSRGQPVALRPLHDQKFVEVYLEKRCPGPVSTLSDKDVALIDTAGQSYPTVYARDGKWTPTNSNPQPVVVPTDITREIKCDDSATVACDDGWVQVSYHFEIPKKSKPAALKLNESRLPVDMADKTLITGNYDSKFIKVAQRCRKAYRQ
jgi:hypothetical protein